MQTFKKFTNDLGFVLGSAMLLFIKIYFWASLVSYMVATSLYC